MVLLPPCHHLSQGQTMLGLSPREAFAAICGNILLWFLACPKFMFSLLH